jgi:hypothetical protein
MMAEIAAEPISAWRRIEIEGVSRTYKTGRFTVRRKTIAKCLAAKLKDIRAQLRKRMHDRIPGTVAWLQQVVKGYFQYHAIAGNFERMRAFRSEVRARSWKRRIQAKKSLRKRIGSPLLGVRTGCSLGNGQVGIGNS